MGWFQCINRSNIMILYSLLKRWVLEQLKACNNAETTELSTIAWNEVPNCGVSRQIWLGFSQQNYTKVLANQKMWEDVCVVKINWSNNMTWFLPRNGRKLPFHEILAAPAGNYLVPSNTVNDGIRMGKTIYQLVHIHLISVDLWSTLCFVFGVLL